MWPLVSLFWIKGGVSFGFQRQLVLPYLHCRGKCNIDSPRSTSGDTPADLLMASIVWLQSRPKTSPLRTDETLFSLVALTADTTDV